MPYVIYVSLKFSIYQLWYKILLASLHCPLKYLSAVSFFLVNCILTTFKKFLYYTSVLCYCEVIIIIIIIIIIYAYLFSV